MTMSFDFTSGNNSAVNAIDARIVIPINTEIETLCVIMEVSMDISLPKRNYLSLFDSKTFPNGASLIER